MHPERHVWAETYDCDPSAVLATQRESAKAIAKCVATTLWSGDPCQPLRVPRQPVAPEILETYFKGRTELLKMNGGGHRDGAAVFREISVKAPDFAEGLAYSASPRSLRFSGHAFGADDHRGAGNWQAG